MSASSSSANSNDTPADVLEHIAVIGLGIIGSLTALAILQRSSIKQLTIYEVRSKPATIGGALNLSPNAHRAMAALGVSPKRYGGSTPWVLFQNDLGQPIGEFKYGGLHDRWATGYEGLRVVRNDIQDDAIAALRPYQDSGRLRILFNKRATSIEDSTSGATIRFEDGDVVHADLVIGADGIHSFTRSQIMTRSPSPLPFSLPSTSSVNEKAPLVGGNGNVNSRHQQEGPIATYSGVTTIYGLVETRTLEPSLLSPLDTHQSIRTISPHAGLFAISYARADRSMIHWFSSRTPRIPPSPDKPDPDPESVRSDLLDTYQTFPEPIPALIRATEKIYYWPVYRLAPMPDEWFSSAGRIVLVGDAAHAMPPHAAQGVGMGIEDALIVANIVTALCKQSSSIRTTTTTTNTTNNIIIVQPCAELWRREYQSKRISRVHHFVSHAESQGRARMDTTSKWTFLSRIREWGLWIAFPLINSLAWVHGNGSSENVGVRMLSRVLVIVGLGDVQGWGYDPDREVVNLTGLALKSGL